MEPIAGSRNFNSNDWDLDKPASAQRTDPGCWNGLGNCEPLPPIVNDELILFITEVSDPLYRPDSRFIELYSPNKPDHTVGDNWELKIVGTGGLTTINLEGFVTDSNGFIVICQSQSDFPKCNYRGNIPK
eukprot:897269_1